MMKVSKKKINFSNWSTACSVWMSAVVRYLITELDDVIDELQYINTLRLRSVGADHFGYNLREYIHGRLEYNNSLQGEEQIRDLAKIYIQLIIFEEMPVGIYYESLASMKRSITEEGIIRLDFMYIRNNAEFVRLREADGTVMHWYVQNDSSSTVYTIAVPNAVKVMALQMTDILRHYNTEIQQIKSLSRTDSEFGIAYKAYMDNRLGYIKLIEGTIKLFHLFCIEKMTAMFKGSDFGNSSREIARLTKKMRTIKSETLNQLGIGEQNI